MRPTWNVATIVEPLEKLSGSTSVWWLVVADPAQVACVNGSLLMTSDPTADAVPAGPRITLATAAATTAGQAIFRRAVLGTRRTIAPPLNQPTALLLDEWAYTHHVGPRRFNRSYYCFRGGACGTFSWLRCVDWVRLGVTDMLPRWSTMDRRSRV